MRSGLALVGDDRRKRGSVPAEVHEILWDEYSRTGSPPPANYIADVTGIGVTAVRRALRALHEEGILAQPHGERAPYIPLYRPDGTRVRPVLVAVDDEGGDVKVQEPKSTAELLEEALRRVRELED